MLRAHEELRERMRKKGIDVPPDAPHMGEALLGHAPGVLAVEARLPEISDGVMHGAPAVKLAVLNGVNEENRDEYIGALADLHIPRVVHARVDGKQANFSLNLDEAGGLSNMPDERSPQAAWLVARGGIGRKARPGDGYENEERGLDALLHELQVTEVRGKLL